MKAQRFYAMAHAIDEVAKHQRRELSPGERVRCDMYLRDGDAEQVLAERHDARARIFRRIGYREASPSPIVSAHPPLEALEYNQPIKGVTP
jgi:hypothetical protein